MAVAASPWAYRVHVGAWVLVVALAVTAWWLLRSMHERSTTRQRAQFAAGLLLLLVAVGWPLADLAAHWSLTALVLQRMLLLLAIPPLLVLGLPQSVMSAITRPAPVDWLVQRCSKPVNAVVIVTVVAVGTLSEGAVAWQASSLVGRWVLYAVLLAAGLVLWAPVLERIPGTRRPSALGRTGYLVVQSIVPSFLAIVWIFAKHPLYPAFSHQRLFGLEPVTDQQLAGFLAKFGTIAVLWTVAFVIINRAQGLTSGEEPEDPLRWADVERELERVARLERRATNPAGRDHPSRAPDHGPGAGPGQRPDPDSPP